MKSLKLRAAIIAATGLAVIMLAACTRDDPSRVAASPRFVQTRSVSSDALSVAVSVSQTEIAVADRLTILFELRQNDGRSPEWPDALRETAEGQPFGEIAKAPAEKGEIPAAAPWTVVSAARQVVAPGHEMLTLVLEPYLAGEKSIPAFRFGQGRTAVVSEPVAIRVLSSDAAATPSAAPTDGDVLAAINDLGPSLPPAMMDVPLWRRPMMIALAVGSGALIVLGLGGVWAVRRLTMRTPSPDEQFRRAMRGIRSRSGTTELDPSRIIEDSIRALRSWLVERKLATPGVGTPELCGALLGCVRVGLLGQPAIEAAGLIAAIERIRFGPDIGPRPDVAAKVVEVFSKLADSAEPGAVPTSPAPGVSGT